MPRDPRRKVLNSLLADALRGREGHLLGTGWPWDQTDEFNTVDAVQLVGQGAGREPLPWLTLDDLMSIVAAHPKRDPVVLLRNLKAVLLSGDEAVSPQIPALKWIAFETRIDDALYVFQDGRWFTMTSTYHEQIRAEADRILSQASCVALPPWMTGHEKAYNVKVAEDDPAFLALDRKLIRTAMHPRGIELCDLLGPGDEFIHLKELRGSDEASHLFSQALVATDQLLLDGEGRQKFAEKVSALSGGARTAPEHPEDGRPRHRRPRSGHRRHAVHLQPGDAGPAGTASRRPRRQGVRHVHRATWPVIRRRLALTSDGSGTQAKIRRVG
ncbi:MAG: TIGR04141 family sporadically distributed protein [Kineosporiaceae bacterium]